MKNSNINFVAELGKVMNTKKVEPKAISALKASILRGQKLTK